MSTKMCGHNVCGMSSHTVQFDQILSDYWRYRESYNLTHSHKCTPLVFSPVHW